MSINKCGYGFKDERQASFPMMLCLEITNVCNFNCIHCPYPNISKHPDFTPKFMDWDVYKKIIEETAGFKDTIVRFVCDGEPMMHPNFLQMVEFVKHKGIGPVCVTTNGYFLDQDGAKRLIECGCDLIEISLDALSEDIYKKIRIGGDFKKVIDNINQLLKIRNLSSSRTKVMVSAIDQPLVKDELEKFKSYWTQKVDRVIIRQLTSIGGLVENNEKDSSILKKDRWPCPLLWQRFFISVDGYSEFCVDDWLDETMIADIKQESIADTWTSDKYQQLRQLHFAREFSGIEKCNVCQDWTARTWDYDYFYALEKTLRL